MPRVTVADLFYAWRQAKTALFFDRRGVGLQLLAEFEEDLPARLRELEQKLDKGISFRNVPIGRVFVLPRSFGKKGSKPGSKGESLDGVYTPKELEVQIRLCPSPEYAIVEALFLRYYGAHIESGLSKVAIGNRLDLRDGKLHPGRRWIFKYWPKSFEHFRDAPLQEIKRRVGAVDCVLVNADVRRFYDSIDPSFLMSERFRTDAPDGYDEAAQSLVDSYSVFRKRAGEVLQMELKTGIPIGCLTSPVVANAALARLDAHIVRARPIRYLRYVDDMVVVLSVQGLDLHPNASGSYESKERECDVLNSIFPFEQAPFDWKLDNRTLGLSEHCCLKLHRDKTMVRVLRGEDGLKSVTDSLSYARRVVSRSHSFLDPEVLLNHHRRLPEVDFYGEFPSIYRRKESPLAFRPVDKMRLHAFALSSVFKTMERATSMLSVSDARELVDEMYGMIPTGLEEGGDWVDGLEASIRLFRIAVGANEQKTAGRIKDLLLGAVEGLRSVRLRYNGNELSIDADGIREYLTARLTESFVASVPTVELNEYQEIHKIGASLDNGWLKIAKELQRSDLRARDRVDDDPGPEQQVGDCDSDWNDLRKELSNGSRWHKIEMFIERSSSMGQTAWKVDPCRLFLSTRPPSYYDIAQVMLDRLEYQDDIGKVFEQVLKTVNEVRGTSYKDTIARVSGDRIIDFVSEEKTEKKTMDPVVVLGNLKVGDKWIMGALGGETVRSRKRLNSITTVVGKAQRIARRIRSEDEAAIRSEDEAARASRREVILLTPELSMPRSWLRDYAHYIARYEEFSAILGAEYRIDGKTAINQAYAVIPGPYNSVVVIPWTKKHPARIERRNLEKRGMTFPAHTPPLKGIVVRREWGSLSCLICSEMIETKRIADLFGRIELLMCPAWNPDRVSYDHLIRSAGLQLHAIVAVANTAKYSDCRVWAPRKASYERDLCRLIEPNIDDVVQATLPMSGLKNFRDAAMMVKDNVEEETMASSEMKEGEKEKEPKWKPLPPGWEDD